MQLPAEAPTTVHEAFARAAATHGDRPCLAVLPETAKAYGVAAGEHSYRDALVRISGLIEAYRAQGLRSRSSCRHFAGEPASLFLALVRIECAGRLAA